MRPIVEWMAFSLGGGLLLIIPLAVIGFLIARGRGAVIGAAIANFLLASGNIIGLYQRGNGDLSYDNAEMSFIIASFSLIPFSFLLILSMGLTEDNLYSKFKLDSKFLRYAALFIAITLCSSLGSFLIWLIFDFRNAVYDETIGYAVGYMAWGATALVVLLIIRNLNSSSSGPKSAKMSSHHRGESTLGRPSTASEARSLDVRDPYAIAGEELLSGSVEPTAWARALVDGEEQGDAFKARYIRERVKAIQQERRRWEAAIKKEKKAIADIATKMSVIQHEVSQFASSRGVSEDEAKVMAAYMIYKDASDFIVYTNGIKEFRSFPSVWSAAFFASKVQSAVAHDDLPYRFKETELIIYGNGQLGNLQKLIDNQNELSLAKIRNTICGKIGWDSWNARSWSVRSFLEEYYRQLRESLDILPR